MKKTVLYVRVSTKDKGQDVENQLIQLKEYLTKMDMDLFQIYQDNETGTKGREKRPGLAAMFKAAHQRKFDVLVIWSLDRFTREGPRLAWEHLNKLDQLGVKLISYTEEWLNTTHTLARDILIGVVTAIAASEADKISQRTKAGLARKRAEAEKKGEVFKIGRSAHKNYDPDLESKIKDYTLEGLSINKTADKLNIHRGTVTKYRKILKEKGELK